MRIKTGFSMSFPGVDEQLSQLGVKIVMKVCGKVCLLLSPRLCQSMKEERTLSSILIIQLLNLHLQSLQGFLLKM